MKASGVRAVAVMHPKRRLTARLDRIRQWVGMYWMGDHSRELTKFALAESSPVQYLRDVL
jgi:hypothetical protein